MAVVDSHRWNVLSRLKVHLLAHRGRIVAGFVSVLLTNVFLLAAPRVTGYAVDSLAESVTREKLTYYGLVIVGLAVCEGIFRFSMRRLIIGVSRDIEYELRNDLFRHLEILPTSFYQKNKTGDLMSRATNDLSNVRMLLGPGIMYTANTIVVTAFAVVLMLKINWHLTLFALLSDRPLLRQKDPRPDGRIPVQAGGSERSRAGKHGGHTRRQGVRTGKI